MKKYLLALAAAVIFTFSGGCGNDGTPTDVSGTAPAYSASSTVDTRSAPVYTFAVCGDNRAEGIENGVLQRIVGSARSSGAAFIVDTGDVSGDGSLGELRLYKDLMQNSGLKFYTVPGNHDVGAGGTSVAYETVIGPAFYSFDFRGDHFIVVDNADDKTGIDDAQMQWLDADLAANASRRHQFIFAHIPVADPSLPSGHATGEKGGDGLRSGQRLAEDALRYPNVSDYFFGHIHAYFAYTLGGVNAYITGGAGAPLYFPENAGGYYHYLLVKVFPDRVDVEVVRI